ncbi:homoserine dehydrogenase [Apibacter muscae]|uniref:homoserine dehydrogenase n=1 Tax=Apibacter muscae TaxID=2509004 RepID=UPI0011ACF564|nr:homoserine dehydrogenase [Apibacter muscae]TWP22900.1 homoserine dehydrogenase [Apibacter muscae]
MKRNRLKLGIFGFGCVGTGLYKVLEETGSVEANIKKICIKHANKPRPIDAKYFTTHKEDLLNDPEINVIVELIDDAEAAFEIVSEAMKKGKDVVSANKKMIAEHLPELLELEKKYQVSFLYEASVCASIPIIRNLEEYYDNDLLTSVSGIFNGSTNYILTQMIDDNIPYPEALKEAQNKGFAETDPTLDVEGIDPKYKLCIILFHAFGLITKPENIFNFGISRINDFDLNFATQRNYAIKLIASCKKNGNEISGLVAPSFIENKDPLAHVKYEYNGVVLESAFSENQLMIGKGAGDKPTGSAVLSDISALTYGYRYENKKYLHVDPSLKLESTGKYRVYVRYYDDFDSFDDFLTMEEKFISPQGNYFIGIITLDKIINSKWIKDKNINVIFCNQNIE